MRLYLSSFRLGDHSGRLVDLVGSGSRVAVIGNALDTAPAAVRRAGVAREIDDLHDLGLVAEELDLRAPHGVDDLRGYGAVWVRGGNAFVLRQAMATAKADVLLDSLIRADAIVYAGYSAGPVVLAPSLRGIDQVDDISAVERPIWAGLGILDRPFVPHVDSPDHPETADCDRLSERLSERGIRHWALRDGDVLVSDRGRVEHLTAST